MRRVSESPMTAKRSMPRLSSTRSMSVEKSRMDPYRWGVDEPMPGRSMPTMRRPRDRASARASTGIWRRAPGVPWNHSTGSPSGGPNSAKPRRRSGATTTVPSRRGGSTSVTPRACHPSRPGARSGGQGAGQSTGA